MHHMIDFVTSFFLAPSLNLVNFFINRVEICRVTADFGINWVLLRKSYEKDYPLDSWSRIFEKDHPWEHTKMPRKTIRLRYRPVVQMMEVPHPGYSYIAST